jgi:tetratricopeptide (TPR) repeat protein
MMYDETILKLLDQGLTAYGLGNLEEALTAWRRVLELDPTNARARDYIIFIEKHRASRPQPVPPPKPPEVDDTEAPTEYTRPAKSIFQSAHWGDIYEGQPIQSNAVEALMQQQPIPALGPPPQPEMLTTVLPPKPVVPFGATANVPDNGSALDLVPADTQPEPIESNQNLKPSEPLLKAAQDRMDLNDFSGALELLQVLLSQNPDHPRARQMQTEAQQRLTEMLFSKLGNLDRVPRVCMRGDEIIWLNLDHRAGFVLSLVDGTISFDEILTICGLSQLEGTRILVQLLQNNVITAG